MRLDFGHTKKRILLGNVWSLGSGRCASSSKRLGGVCVSKCPPGSDPRGVWLWTVYVCLDVYNPSHREQGVFSVSHSE